MTSNVQKLAMALVAAATLAGVGAASNALAVDRIKCVITCNSNPPGGTPPVFRGPPVIGGPLRARLPRIEGLRGLRFEHLRDFVGHGLGYGHDCYFVLKFGRIVKICPEHDYD